MPELVECDTHGPHPIAYTCSHVIKAHGLGFNRSEPTEADPFPDAWCDDCELIRAAHDGWNDQSEKLTSLSILCSACYNVVRIRNTRTETTLDDLADLRWKCGSCEEWHTGPCLDFGYDWPDMWTEEHAKTAKRRRLLPHLSKNDPDTFLDEDACSTDGEHFYIRGLIHLPIIGTDETFRLGVWGSLSEENFRKLRRSWDDPKRAELGQMFSWLCNWIPEFGEVEDIKMQMHIQPPPDRPHFEIEHTEHPLADAYHHGITAERVKEIMLGRLSKNK